MTSSKIISVIIPVYKVEAYLDRCVKSILSQSYRDLEIILVDDGSPDRCGERCDNYAALDNRIKVIHQKNAGPSGARNAGLDICCGDYVCFVDSDDEIDPQMLQIQYEAIESGQYDLAICGYQHFSSDDMLPSIRTNRIEKRELNSDELWREIFVKLNNSVWNKLYRNRLISNLRFSTGLFHNEDFLFNLKYISNCRCGIQIDAPLYHYFIRSDSITKSAFNEKKFDEVTVKDMAREIVREQRPALLNTAHVYCFRARMNVLRSIYAGGREREYTKKVQEYIEYTEKWYPKVHKRLRLKENIEYQLLHKIRMIYRLMTKARA